MSTKPAGRAVGTRGHVLTGCLERTLHKQPPLGASPAGGSLPQPCPSSTQKNDTCFPLLHPSPSSEATGWDCPEGWTVSGLVSVRRAPHFKGTPSPCDIVKSRAHTIFFPFTYPSLRTAQEALLFLLPEHSSPDRCLTPNLLRVSVKLASSRALSEHLAYNCTASQLLAFPILPPPLQLPSVHNTWHPLNVLITSLFCLLSLPPLRNISSKNEGTSVCFTG